MLKFYRNVLAAGVVALGLAACGDKVTVTNPPTATPVVHSVTVVPASVTATVGQAGVTFVASVVADSGLSSAVTWSSTNATVATVSSGGLITALAPGQTTIVATSVGDPTKTGAGSLQVVALPPNITAFTVSPTNGAISVGGTLQGNYSVTLTQGAPAASVTWASSNVNIASVSTAGTITGVSAGAAIITATATSGTQTATATIGVNVGTGPTGVISFSVSPSAMTLFATQTQQATATVTMAPTFTAPTVTWTSLAPTVATVSSTGLVTAVAQGTAVVTATIGTGATTLTQSVVVTVAQGASISINSINAGATAGTIPGCAGVAGQPVVLTNVNCQINVVMNLNAGVQPLDSLVVRMKQPSGFKTLATQNYGNTIPSSGNVTLLINTANFVKNAAAGTTKVDLFNGPTTLQTQVYPHIANGGTVFNCQVGASDPTCAVVNSMVLTNTDGWAADITKPSVAAVPAGPTRAGGFATGANAPNAGTTFWGGPGPTGQTTVEIYPVIYNNNPTFPVGSAQNRCTGVNGVGCVSTVTWTLGTPLAYVGGPAVDGTCAIVAASTQTTLPFKLVYGNGAGSNIACANYENTVAIRDNVLITNAIDGVANPLPLVGTAVAPVAPAVIGSNTTLIPNTVVFGSTPDSGRFDYKAPTVPSPSITRTAPAQTGWVNAGYSFLNWASSDAGVGIVTGTLASRFASGVASLSYSAAATATSTGCGNGPAVNAMATGTGADIPECPILVNSLGGTVATGAGTAPYTVSATEADRLGNAATSAASATFGVDKTAPLIRWGTAGDPSFAVPAVNTVGLEVNGAAGSTSSLGTDDTLFTTKPTTQRFRAEFNDDRAGFIAVGGGNSPQTHALTTAGHVNPAGICVAFPVTDPLTVPGATPAGGIGPNFVTAPLCTLVNTTTALVQRIDGWQSGASDPVPQPEGYYFYKTTVFDAAGNQSAVLADRAAVNSRNPFATGLGLPATLTAAAFNIAVTGSDSVEVLNVSQAFTYPNLPTVAVARYTQQAIGTFADNVITSPFSVSLNPPTGTPYARGIEQVTGAVWSGLGPAPSNVAAAPTNLKPTAVQEWSFNPSNFNAASAVIAIPGLNVQTGITYNTFNTANTINPLTNFRIIPTLSVVGNPFLSGEGFRAQAISPTGTPNSPFARVDFYQLDAGGTWWNYLGSVQTSNVQPSLSTNDGLIISDDGVNRSWVYQLGTFVNAWNGAAQAGPTTGSTVFAVGVSAAGDGIASLAWTY